MLVYAQASSVERSSLLFHVGQTGTRIDYQGTWEILDSGNTLKASICRL